MAKNDDPQTMPQPAFPWPQLSQSSKRDAWQPCSGLKMLGALTAFHHDQPAPVPGTKRLREEHQNQNQSSHFTSILAHIYTLLLRNYID